MKESKNITKSKLIIYSLGVGVLYTILLKILKTIWIFARLKMSSTDAETTDILNFIFLAKSEKLDIASFIDATIIAPPIENIMFIFIFIIMFKWIKLKNTKPNNIAYCVIMALCFSSMHAIYKYYNNWSGGVFNNFLIYTTLILGFLMATLMTKADKAGYKPSVGYFLTVITHSASNAMLLIIHYVYASYLA